MVFPFGRILQAGQGEYAGRGIGGRGLFGAGGAYGGADCTVGRSPRLGRDGFAWRERNGGKPVPDSGGHRRIPYSRAGRAAVRGKMGTYIKSGGKAFGQSAGKRPECIYDALYYGGRGCPERLCQRHALHRFLSENMGGDGRTGRNVWQSGLGFSRVFRQGGKKEGGISFHL